MTLINVSIGEVVDKMTILEIKSGKTDDEEKLRYINNELAYLRNVVISLEVPQIRIDQLKIINENLWEIEDQIRRFEAAKDFGPGFVALARSVYKMNDRRFEVKSQINDECDSAFKEQKVLPAYG